MDEPYSRFKYMTHDERFEYFKSRGIKTGDNFTNHDEFGKILTYWDCRVILARFLEGLDTTKNPEFKN